MRTESPTSPGRAAAIAATATTLVALMAMSATVAAGPAPRVADLETRGEARVVRAMAAAVAAVARDLIGTEHATAAATLFGPADVTPAGDAVAPLPACPQRPPGSVVLEERLLDLPPPVC